MKKFTLLTSIIFCYIFTINAQEFELDDSYGSPSPFVVLRIEGSAKYLENGSDEAKNVVSGMILPESGTLTLNKKSQLKLSWKNQAVILSKKGTYSLKNEAKKMADASGDTPVDDFLVELGASSGFGDTGGDGERKSGDAKGDTLGGSGWGTREKIAVIMPIGGIVPLEEITFSWAGTSGKARLKVSLFKGEEKTATFSAITKNNSFTIDVSQLPITEIDAYFWMVENISDPDIKSEKVPIHFGHKNQNLEVIRGMLSDREYSYSDPWLKLLREAHALQKENMIYAANEKYQQGLKEFSDNLTIKKMYAQFLTKYGLGELADEIFE